MNLIMWQHFFLKNWRFPTAQWYPNHICNKFTYSFKKWELRTQNKNSITKYILVWRPGIEVSVTQRLGVFKPLTCYADSRTNDSIPGLYWYVSHWNQHTLQNVPWKGCHKYSKCHISVVGKRVLKRSSQKNFIDNILFVSKTHKTHIRQPAIKSNKNKNSSNLNLLRWY